MSFVVNGLRRLLNKPRPDDWSPLSKFYYADEALNEIANELDSFDGRRDPERCNTLVIKLRVAQDRVLHIVNEMLLLLYPREVERASRDFRVKFPDEIVHDYLPGQLWFGAECLAVGSNITDHEVESEAMRPLAKQLTKHLEHLRELLKIQSLKDPHYYPDNIKAALLQFDRLFADFEFRYVSAMVPVKSCLEYDAQLDVAVLFSEVLERALKAHKVTQEQIDYCDPSVIIVIPRLAIVWGLLYYPDGALCVHGRPDQLSEMFRPFFTLLVKIRNLLQILTKDELDRLETALCSGESEDPTPNPSSPSSSSSSVATDAEPQMSSFSVTEFIEHKKSSKKLEAVEEDAGEETESSTASAANAPPTAAATTKLVDGAVSENGSSSVTKHLSRRNARRSSGRSAAELRARFRSSEDLVHRLFVCVAGVADQLQTNYSADVRKVLKMILQPQDTPPVYEVLDSSTIPAIGDQVPAQTASQPVNEEETGVEVQESLPLPSFIGVRWVPDEECTQCVSCEAPFTLVRRRHHCRNCGRIFCQRCSCNATVIQELGYEKPVRVCNLCYLHRQNPFRAAACATPPANVQQQTREDSTSSSPEELVVDVDESGSPPPPAIASMMEATAAAAAGPS